MSFKGDVRASRRFHFWLPADLESLLVAFARRHGLGLGPSIRLVLGRSLREEDGAHQSDESLASVAALIAAEHAVLMVSTVLPEGQRRKSELAPLAVAAAEERLALLREQG